MSEKEQEDKFGWQSRVLLIAADAAAQGTVELLKALDVRIVAHVPVSQAAEQLLDQGPLDLILIEAAGAPPTDVVAAVNAVIDFAEVDDCAVIITIDEAQIDLVGTAMLGDPYVVLCTPAAEERVAAIVAALHRDRAPWHNDASRDSEASRLRRLNEEIARIAEALTRLTQSPLSADAPPGTFPATIESPRHTFDGSYHGSDGATAAEVRRIIRGRRLRDQFLGDGLFEDPAWDILLDLYAAHLEGTQVSVSSLCIAASVPPTTALRWIGRMSDLGMLERRPDPFDRRRAYMGLAKATVDGLDRYFTALKQANLSAS